MVYLILILVISFYILLLMACIVRKYYYVAAKPNEWLIILREGQCKKLGIGISSFLGYNDVFVKFPSKIHKVNFSAMQVTTEMQGLQISGAIIWSIYREGDGPLRAYRYLGKDLETQSPTSANQCLVEMANGIVRHKIANSSIYEILRNRHIIREDIKRELNRNINGWGVWLETVEITDVKIMSNSIFENFQCEFREKERLKAEMVSMESQSIIKSKQLE